MFFGFYRKLSGMTGTAQAAAAEFFESYKLKVRCVTVGELCIVCIVCVVCLLCVCSALQKFDGQAAGFVQHDW